MVEEDSPKRRRVLVPFDVASFLRAPYGWTKEMRRAEGYPELGARPPADLSPWASAGQAVVVYGPLLLGALIGSRVEAWFGGGWAGAGLGTGIALTGEAIVLLLALPIVGFVRGLGPSPRD